MGRRLWIDVFKGEHLFVLINFLGGNLSSNDSAEKAILVRIGHRLHTLGHKQ